MSRHNRISVIAAGAAALLAGAAIAGPVVAGGAAGKKVDCKRIAGQMQIRILELRGNGPRGGSSTAESLQSAAVPIFGGTRRGTDASGERAGDIARLKASNDLLKLEKCPHFDLEAELAKPVTAPTPKLIKPRPGK